MDLNTIEQVVRPRRRAQLPAFRDGDAFLAGGTWLFSEPQTGLRRLVDLPSLCWPALERTPEGLLVGATCTLAELEAFDAPAQWRAARLIGQCCRALLGSFKIRRMATVGGNLCLALPASPMAALAVALDGVCTIWTPGDAERILPVSALITGANRCALTEGEVLRSVLLREQALRRRASLRQISLTPLGRSAALLIGTRRRHGMVLTITASVACPVQIAFDTIPALEVMHEAIEAAVPAWHDDVHGAPAWRQRMTHRLASEIVAELNS